MRLIKTGILENSNKTKQRIHRRVLLTLPSVSILISLDVIKLFFFYTRQAPHCIGFLPLASKCVCVCVCVFIVTQPFPSSSSSSSQLFLFIMRYRLFLRVLCVCVCVLPFLLYDWQTLAVSWFSWVDFNTHTHTRLQTNFAPVIIFSVK